MSLTKYRVKSLDFNLKELCENVYFHLLLQCDVIPSHIGLVRK